AIPKNPSHYTIARDPAAAKERQKYVLQQMAGHGWADAVEASKEMAEAVPAPYEHAYLNRAPHYVEHVRRLLVEEFGEEVAYERGLTVYTGMHAGAQVAAQESLRQGLEELARRQGWAGAPVRIEVDRFERLNKVLHQAFAEEEAKHVAVGRSGRRIWDLARISAEMLVNEEEVREAVRLTPLKEGARVVGMVTHIDSKNDVIWVDLGSIRGRMTLKSLAWARRFAATSDTPVPKDAGEVVKKGDLIAVNVLDVPVRLGKDTSKLTVRVELVPQPVAEGALASIDPYTRYVRALVGGYRQEGGGLIRAIQSRRQPGSAFKPIVYAAGLEATVITPASICPDSPVVIYDPWTGKPWKPQNYEDGRFDGNITYRTALMRSKNTCSVKLIEKLGPEKVIAMARALGVTSDLPENLTLALGTGDLSPLDLANAYATIAAGGNHAQPIFIRKVVDASGSILKEVQAEPEEVLRPAVAYVLTQMMRSVVESGTATRALVLDRPLAGKTGTSNESRNVWFSGFSPELVATVWVGFDNNAPLGRETGGSAALPIWIRYMGRALAGTPPSEFTAPEDVAVVKVDPQTGIPSDGPLAIEETFLAGTEPLDKTRPLESIFIEDDA
ncbi:MAG: penicillin-binding protein, partial [Deltaproteobacteria bacterium]|nr:penicillin-binding protein [Deltaproteobacteria bacterium]